MFEIRPTDAFSKLPTGVFSTGRILIGSSENCNFVISHETISPVHAAIEIFSDHAVIYDMNSTNGTFVDDKKIVRKEIRIGNVFRLADIEFQFRKQELK